MTTAPEFWIFFFRISNLFRISSFVFRIFFVFRDSDFGFMFAIRVDNLGKCYQLGATHAGSVRELVNRGWNRLFRRSHAAHQPLTLDPEAANRVEGKSFWALRDVSFEVKPGE